MNGSSFENKNKCDELRNPFIKNPSTEVYSISDKIIEEMRTEYINEGENGENREKKLKLFKKKILPKLMSSYKAEFIKFNSSNANSMELLVTSNSFKQFVDLYFNRDYFPELEGLNQLIESKNRIIESDQDNAISDLYKQIENAEHIYFEKNKIYKENILKFINALSKKYFTELRSYADYETTKSIIELNTLTNYVNFLKTIPNMFLQRKPINEIKKEINKNFNLIIQVFPSSVYELFPREIEDFYSEQNKKVNNILTTSLTSGISKNVANVQNSNNKSQNLIKKIRALKEHIAFYSKTFTENIETEEAKYKRIIDLYNQIIKKEEQEKVIFNDLQSTRNQLNAKIKELGKGIQDKKYSLLSAEYNKAYENYTKIVCAKIELYKNLYDLMKKENQSSSSNSRTNELLQGFDLKLIFQHIFDNGILINKENMECNDDNLRKYVFNYLYRETSKGMDDIKLESLRNQDKRNIYEFTLYMNDIFEKHIYFFNNLIEKHNELKAKVDREINILRNMEESAKSQLTNKKSYIDDLDAEKKKLETDITTLRTSTNKKKENIDTQLNSSTIVNVFGPITFENILTFDTEKREEAYMKKIGKSLDDLIEKINREIDNSNLNTLVGKQRSAILEDAYINLLLNIIKYQKIDTSSKLPITDIESKFINDAIRNKLKEQITELLNKVSSNQYNNLTTNNASKTATTDKTLRRMKELLKMFIQANINIYEELYKSERADISSRDSRFKTANDAIVSVISLVRTFNEENIRLEEAQRKLSNIISEVREIREGPEEFTKQLNAKNVFNKRIDEQLNELKDILSRKEKNNKELQDLISDESFKTIMNELYGGLISRYKSVTDLIKKKNIRSEVYNLFSKDILYKTIKTLHDLVSPVINDNSKIPAESVVELTKSFEDYITNRLQDFPKVEEKDEGEIKFKRYQLQSMANVLRGQKIGDYYIREDANMKQFVKKIKNENINNISSRVKKLYNRNLSMNQINQEKLKYYLRTYGNMSKNVVVTGGNKENMIQTIGNGEKMFMKGIYNILLEDNTKNSNNFVDKLKKFEYKLLQLAKSKIIQFKKMYDKSDSKNGSDKITEHIRYIYNMTNVSLDKFDQKLTEIFKRGKSSNELINILIISQYIYMEVIMIYALSYFC